MKARIDYEYNGKASVSVYQVEMPDRVASLAMTLIEKHAMVAADINGEDSAGRQKCRLQTPDELVTRSFEISDLFWAEATRRGHLVALPDLNDVNAEYDRKRAERHGAVLEASGAVEDAIATLGELKKEVG